jgi:hypothetical protein
MIISKHILEVIIITIFSVLWFNNIWAGLAIGFTVGAFLQKGE